MSPAVAVSVKVRTRLGLDLWAMVVSLDAPPMRVMRTDARAWVDAVEHWPFCNRPSESLPEISRQLQASLPEDVDRLALFPDRSYEQAEYLLDPVFFRAPHGWPERERSLPYRIIQGDQIFAEHAASVQGSSWRCSTAAFLTEAAATINAFDVAAARREFSVSEMEALGVYKVDSTCSDDEAFDRILNNLRQLALTYTRIAESGMDLVIEKD